MSYYINKASPRVDVYISRVPPAGWVFLAMGDGICIMYVVVRGVDAQIYHADDHHADHWYQFDMEIGLRCLSEV